MLATINELEAARNHQDSLTGVPSGFSALDRLTSGWQKSDLVIMAARPGMGKCLGKGTKVIMYDGTLRKVEDVHVGDLLMGDDSAPRRVLSLARGRENMYHVHQDFGMSYRVNESHILSLKSEKKEGQYSQDQRLDICLRDYLAKPDKFKSDHKGYKVPVEFEEKHLDLDAYAFGLSLGEVERKALNLITCDHHATAAYQNIYATQRLVEQDNLLADQLIPQHYLCNSTKSDSNS